MPTKFIIADKKWLPASIIQTLDSLRLKYSEVGRDKQKELAANCECQMRCKVLTVHATRLPY